MTNDVVIAGGGLAGLTCAVALADAGLRVTVLEREETPGGRARSWTDAATGDAIALGPHILISEYPNMRKLLRRLGTEDRVTWLGSRFITLVDGTRPIPMNMSRLPAPFHFVPSLLADPTLRNRDWLSNTAIALYVLSIGEPELLEWDRRPALEALRRFRVSEAYQERFWRFISLAIMNVPLEICSAGAILRFYRRLIGRNGFEVGLPDGDLGGLFVPGAERAIADAGGELRRGVEVRRLITEGASAAGFQLSSGERVTARFSVAALPPAALLRILPPDWRESHELLRGMERFLPSPYISVYLWFDRKLTDLRFWSRCYRADDLNLDFYDLSNIGPGAHEGPSRIASNIIYSARAGHLSDHQVVARTVAELAEFLPAAATARLLHAVVNRIAMAIHAPVVGSEQWRPREIVPAPGLVLAGDWMQTGLPASMESACASGWRAAERILHAMGRPARLVEAHRELDPLAQAMGWGVRAIRRLAAILR